MEIDTETIDNLFKSLDLKKGTELFGANGLVKQLTKRLVERDARGKSAGSGTRGHQGVPRGSRSRARQAPLRPAFTLAPRSSPGKRRAVSRVMRSVRATNRRVRACDSSPGRASRPRRASSFLHATARAAALDANSSASESPVTPMVHPSTPVRTLARGAALPHLRGSQVDGPHLDAILGTVNVSERAAGAKMAPCGGRASAPLATLYSRHGRAYTEADPCRV
jgi:hypothetical protein